MHFKYAPGAYLLYAPGALCIQICSWSIFDLEYYSRLFMLLEQLYLEQLLLEKLLLEHNLGPKSHKSVQITTNTIEYSTFNPRESSFSSLNSSHECEETCLYVRFFNLHIGHLQLEPFLQGLSGGGKQFVFLVKKVEVNTVSMHYPLNSKKKNKKKHVTLGSPSSKLRILTCNAMVS